MKHREGIQGVLACPNFSMSLVALCSLHYIGNLYKSLFYRKTEGKQSLKKMGQSCYADEEYAKQKTASLVNSLYSEITSIFQQALIRLRFGRTRALCFFVKEFLPTKQDY